MQQEAKHFASFAERYEATLVPVIFRPWAKELIRRLNPKDGENILDLACGTGVVTREIMASGISPGRLTALDHNADMLVVARENGTLLGVEAEWVEGDAGALPFPDDRFDLAFCQQALQFFPDRLAALRELRRVLRPGGRTAFCVQRDLSCNPMLKAQANALEKYVGADAGSAVRAICSLHDVDQLRQLFTGAGFNSIEIESVSLELSHPDGRAFAAGAMGGMHTGDKLSATDQSKRQQCIEEFLSGLDDCYDGTAIRFPHVSHVITSHT